MIEILLTILLIFAGLLGALLLMLLVVLLSPVRLRLALQEGTFFLWAGALSAASAAAQTKKEKGTTAEKKKAKGPSVRRAVRIREASACRSSRTGAETKRGSR